MDSQPVFRDLTPSQSRRNFQLVCQKAKIGVELPINTDAARPRTALGPSILQQERDFRSAIQPDSPVSALLKSVKIPQLVRNTDRQIRETATGTGPCANQGEYTAEEAYRCRCARHAQSRPTRERECSGSFWPADGHGQRRRGRAGRSAARRTEWLRSGHSATRAGHSEGSDRVANDRKGTTTDLRGQAVPAEARNVGYGSESRKNGAGSYGAREQAVSTST